ncbi:hypothetical protein BC829DRAFT_215242 [Chytridium lagenaria]|nr:hypothetical protein BC829DRAFT_215242 [Chytridium lagenaria]
MTSTYPHLQPPSSYTTNTTNTTSSISMQESVSSSNQPAHQLPPLHHELMHDAVITKLHSYTSIFPSSTTATANTTQHPLFDLNLPHAFQSHNPTSLTPPADQVAHSKTQHHHQQQQQQLPFFPSSDWTNAYSGLSTPSSTTASHPSISAPQSQQQQQHHLHQPRHHHIGEPQHQQSSQQQQQQLPLPSLDTSYEMFSQYGSSNGGGSSIPTTFNTNSSNHSNNNNTSNFVNNDYAFPSQPLPRPLTSSTSSIPYFSHSYTDTYQPHQHNHQQQAALSTRPSFSSTHTHR